MNVTNLDKEVYIPPTKRHDGHTEALEEKVDELEAEILSLKKQLKKKNKLPKDMVDRKEYNLVLKQLQAYWNESIPF